jgi:hypothetical protein
MRVEFLPPYSPDYNPIELAFSVIKRRLRRDERLVAPLWRQVDDTNVYTHLYHVIYSITAQDAHSFFHHCQYI